MTPLALTIQLYDRETAQSFISRLAKRHGLSFVQSFCADMGLRWDDVTRGSPEALRILAQLASIDFEALIRFAVTKASERDYTINGQLLTQSTLLRHNLRYCPHCLIEDDSKNGLMGRFGRAEWQLVSFRVCPVHKTPLRVLSKQIRPTSPYDFSARIEESWAEVQGAVDEAQPMNFVSAFEKHLIRRLEGKKDGTWLDQLDLDLLCRLCERLGVGLVFGSSAIPRKLNHYDLIRANAAGFEAVKLGEAGLHSAFESIRLTSCHASKGYSADFRALTRWLVPTNHGEERYQPILKVFTDYIFRNYPISDGQVVLGQTCQKRRVHNPSSASRDLGISTLRITKFAKAMGIENNVYSTGISFEKDKHAHLLNEFARCVTSNVVRERLGLSYEMVDRLFRSGLLKPKFNLPELVPVYHPNDIEKFRQSVFRHAQEVPKIPDGYRPLNDLCSQTKSKIEKLIGLAQLGKLKTLCFQVGGNGLWCLHADPTDVWDQLEIDPAKGFTKLQVKSLLRINDTTIKSLVQSGKLNSDPVLHHRTRRQLRRTVSLQSNTISSLEDTDGISAENTPQTQGIAA